MAKYRRSYRLEKELFLARKKIAKCEAMVRGGVDRKKVDIQQELFNSLRNSLEKEDRLEEEISLCRDRTCDLEAQLLSCGCNVTNLETTRQSLENKNEDLHRVLLKTDQKNADMEITLESVQRERGYLKNGEAQLDAKANEYETRIKKLESDKEILEAELLKLKGIISTLECQIGTLIQNKTDLTAELKEARESTEKSEREYASLFASPNVSLSVEIAKKLLQILSLSRTRSPLMKSAGYTRSPQI
ncbi:hypothetical protein OS493_032031 [Desmophyllum pertusum]|uniref:Uncharacterized protein n=1 Tax=Desmophyllum pertusum TaxID=174260 RepID=A0A9X0CNQ0_9CNID|nr:hypothetical protein OS493_032031 [Desmophyllum pertusum]